MERYATELDLYCWGPIFAGFATLHELRTVYTLDDVVDMHVAMSFKQDMKQAGEQDRDA